MSVCPFCKKQIAMSKAFCSIDCKEKYFQLEAINVPKPFLKRIFVYCTPEQREQEIENFANRHGWQIDLLRMKVFNLAEEHGFEIDNGAENSSETQEVVEDSNNVQKTTVKETVNNPMNNIDDLLDESNLV